MPESPVSRSRALVALTAACAFWALSFPLAKAMTLGARGAAPDASSWFVAAILVAGRFAVGAVVLGVLHRTRPTRSELAQGAALGVSTGIGMLLQTDALAYTEASTSAFLTQGYVFMLPAVQGVLERRMPRPHVLFCAGLVLAGLGILARFDPRTLSLGRGETETLLAAACFTIQILLVGAPRFRRNRGGPITTIMFASIAIVLAPVMILAAHAPGDAARIFEPRGAVLYSVIIVLLPTLASFSLMNRFQQHVTPSEAGITYATEPVFASSLAIVLPDLLSRLSSIRYENETLTERMLVGGALVVLANVILALATGKSET